AFTTAGQAAVINNYGNLVGPNLTYTGITEVDNQIPGPTPANLFGPPALLGDSLLFDPINFSVAVSGGDAELQDGRLSLSLSANSPSNGITSFSMSEGGGYAVNGGTTNTFASETLVVNNLFITAVGGVSINPIVVTPTITFTHTGLAITTTTSDSIKFFGGTGLENGAWTATVSFDLAAALAANGKTGTVTGLTLALDNQLGAQSEVGSSAFIDKKNFLVGPGTGIPEPTTVSLGLISLGLGLIRRRRSSSN
ncbi:MAG TPA: hypothetical protein VKK61_01090, partial [Tepidisphaeraceae bacterium]|nr:hypothetical protein [Tepidisphaeraceae bacterium]